MCDNAHTAGQQPENALRFNNALREFALPAIIIFDLHIKINSKCIAISDLISDTNDDFISIL